MAEALNTTEFHGHSNKGAQFGQVWNSTINNFFSNNEEGSYPPRGQSDAAASLMQGIASDYRQWKDNNPERVEGTCEWLLRDPRFAQWRDSPSSSILHILAGPGCGKSVLARALVDERLCTHVKDAKVLYFFFKQGHIAQESPTTAVSAMLHQLYEQSASTLLEQYAMQKYRNRGSALFRMFGELWDIFTTSITHSETEVVCIIDALDECAEESRAKLMSSVTSFVQRSVQGNPATTAAKFLFTGRPYADSEFEESELLARASFIRFDGSELTDQIAEEINHVIEARVPAIIPKASLDVKQKLSLHLKSMHNRTYLWLHLVLDYIKRKTTFQCTEKKLRALIAQLPPTVDRAYQELLDRSPDPELTKTLLKIVLATTRPLTLREINVALELVLREWNDREIMEMESEAQFVDTITDLCGLFLNVYHTKVYFIHETAREFLLKSDSQMAASISWKNSVEENMAHVAMAKACILRLSDLSETAFLQCPHDPTCNTKEYQCQTSYIPLLGYAAEFWLKHFLRNERDLFPYLRKEAWNVCDPTSVAYQCWSTLSPPAYQSYRPDGYELDVLLRFTMEGSYTIVQELLRRGVNVGVQDYDRSTALHIASRRGFDQIVQLLLEQGAYPNDQDQGGDTALHIASYHGQVQMVQLLLDRGADVNLQEKYGRTAMHVASRRGQERVVEMLLARGADANRREKYGRTTLHMASMNGNGHIAQLLLGKTADINARDTVGRTPLQVASLYGHTHMVQLYMEHIGSQ